MSKTFSAAALAVVLAGSAGVRLSAAGVDADWTRYNKDLPSTRHSTLSSITPANAAKLGPVCIFDTHQRGSFQSGILAIGGTLYFTSSLETYAIDGDSCATRWIVKRDLAAAAPWPVNRGLAYADGRLFRATTDGHLIALDAGSGKLVWDVTIFDTGSGGWISAAPIVWNGIVFIGTAGADVGVDGHIFGIDAATGRIRWTFDTIDKRTSSQWPAASGGHGGGSSWSSFTLDPKTGELFVPVGNPAPDFAPAARKGGNAFTDSIVVLDAKTGRYLWRTQQVQGDFHDWDTAAAPTLVTTAGGSLLAAPSKDGHLYVSDRQTHRLVRRVETTTIREASTPISPGGTHFCPGTLGGTEWNGGSYDPARRLFFVPAIDWCSTLKGNPAAASVTYTPGQPYLGSSDGYGDFDTAKAGWLNAIDLRTGRTVWRFHAASPMVSGVVSTDGGVVAAGDYDGNFRVYDSAKGKPLYAYDVGEPLAGGVIAYGSSGGRQRFAFTAGNTSRTPLPSNGNSRVVVIGLNAPQHPVTVAEDPSTVVTIGKTAPIDGAKIYANNCAGCHGAAAGGGGSAFPPLAGNPVVTGSATTLAHIVKYGLGGKITVGSVSYDGQMPAWAAQLSDAQIAAVLTYLRASHGNHATPITSAQVGAVKQ